MFIQVTHENWVFSLDGKGWLTISGEGKTISHRAVDMTPSELKGFAEGWAVCSMYGSRDSDLKPAPYPVFQ